MYSKQKSLNFGNYVPNDKVLNKKVPENPKYKHVKPAIDTGKNVRKHIDELKEKQKTSVYKKDEVFRRLKVSTFLKLVVAVAIDSPSNENDIANPSNSADIPKTAESSERRGVANVLMGIGELDVLHERKKSHSASSNQEANKTPYLLLDVRDRDAYSKCHIKTAKNYPSTMLSRSVSYETEDMKLFKNIPYKLIAIYDDDETIATRVATTLVERGYENIHLLTGGLKIALELCPHGLTTSSQSLMPVHMLTQNAAAQAQKTEREYFSQEDIDIIQHYLDIYPNRDDPVWSSNFSIKDKSGRSSRSGYESIPAPSRASATSSRNSMCSSSTIEQKHQQSANSRCSRSSHANCNSTKFIEQSRFKSVRDEKPKQPKKAPWK